MAKTETTVETVKMDDQRLVEFPGKRKLQIEDGLDDDGQIWIRLDFRNGETRLFTCPHDLEMKAAAHGLEQKFRDEIAGLEDMNDAVEAVDELMLRLAGGEWNSRRESSGMAGASVLCKALVQVTGQPVGKIREFLATLTNAQKNALRGDEKVAPVVAELEKEKKSKAPAIDTTALLGTFISA